MRLFGDTRWGLHVSDCLVILDGGSLRLFGDTRWGFHVSDCLVILDGGSMLVTVW